MIYIFWKLIAFLAILLYISDRISFDVILKLIYSINKVEFPCLGARGVLSVPFIVQAGQVILLIILIILKLQEQFEMTMGGIIVDLILYPPP